MTTPIRENVLTPEDLKAHTLRILDAARSAFEREDWKALSELLDRSPAGDGYGSENHFISFFGGRDIAEVGEFYQIWKRAEQEPKP